jgi:hypothetical protein
MDLGPLANTSRGEVTRGVLRSPVITWPVGLFMNGELAQVQSGGGPGRLNELGSWIT